MPILSRRVYGDQRALARWANENDVTIFLKIDYYAPGDAHQGGEFVRDFYHEVLIQVDGNHHLWLSSDECRSLNTHQDVRHRS